MIPTIEEVNKVADNCGITFRVIGITPSSTIELANCTPDQLQAFAQHYKEEGRKEQRIEIARIIRNNRGE